MESLEQLCLRVEATNLGCHTSREIFDAFDLLRGHPWEDTAVANCTTYYPLLSGLVREVGATVALEVGTGFGLSAASILYGMPRIDLFVSLDLGIFSSEYGFPEDNIVFARSKILDWCTRKGIAPDHAYFFRVNTQPHNTDNDGRPAGAPYWRDHDIATQVMDSASFDFVFLDGKHTGKGLYNDLKTFWPYVSPGGIVLCDDLHDRSYLPVLHWAGETVESFDQFVKDHSSTISSHFVWDTPHVPPEGRYGNRPMGVIRKLSHETS